MPEVNTTYQVLPGNTMENVTLEKEAIMFVYGTATGTIVSGGSLIVSEGGLAGNTIVNSAGDGTAVGSCVVGSGGSATIMTVGAGGELEIYGRVTSAVVSQGGTATVYQDGQAKEFTIDGGEMDLVAGAYVFPSTGGSKLLVQNQGLLLLFEGARIEGVEVKDSGYVSIDKANMASAFFSYGFATVRDGAVLSSSTVNDGSVITVMPGGMVENVTFNVGGKITGNMYDCRNLRFNAGIVDFNIVADYTGGGFYINDLSTFFSPKTETYHCFYTVTAYIDQECGTYKLIQDATGFLSDQKIWVENYYGGSVLDYITLEEGAKTIEDRQYKLNLSDTNELTLTISALTPPDVKDNLETTCDLYEDMYGSNVNILTGGALNINSGARAMDTTVYEGGTLNINDGGRAIDTYIEAGGSADVSDGGRASGIFVNAGGQLRVREGGKATLVRENGGYVEDDGDVEFEPLAFTGSEINANATVHSGTTAINTTINPNGQLIVFNGGRAETTTVNNGALVVKSGGVADGTLIAMPNAVVTVSSGGKLTGWVMLSPDALVTAAVGATIDFDLVNTKAKPGAAQGLVNNLSVIQFSYNTDFTITVNGKEEAGEYKLAGSAAGFDSYITVQTAFGRELAILSVGGAGFSYRDRTYSLSLDSDNLMLTVNALPADIYGDLNTDYHLTTGEIASAVNVIAGGDLYVDEGGVAVDTTLNPGGYLDVTKDGVAYDTTVDGGGVYVYEDGVIYDTTINSGGRLTVSTGARAVGLTVESGGDVTIYEGAEVYEIKENGGGVFVNAGADVTFVHNEILGLDLYDYDWATVHSGTTATYTTVNWDGRLVVYDGGLVSSSVVCADGALDVEGGEAKGVVVSSGGYVHVASGGSVTGLDAEAGAQLNFAIAPDTYAQGTYDGSDIDIAPETVGLTVASGMTIEVFEGGLAGEITVESGANCLVMSDGEVQDAVVHSGAYFYVASGGSATGLNVDSGARFYLTVAPDTYAQGTYDGEDFKATASLSDYTVLFNGGLFVDEGGRAQNITVEYGADLYVSSGATATKIVENGGYVSFEDGAKVTFTPNEFAGIVTEDMVYREITVHSGTTATDTTLNGEGQMEVYQGGLATVTVVNAYGRLSVSGGSADDTTVYADGSMTVCSGGSAEETAIDGGDMWIGDGGSAYGIKLANGGNLYVGEDSLADNIMIEEGYACVFEGGKVGYATLQTGASLAVSSGGSADWVTVERGAEVEISAYGTATNITESGGFVYVEGGASAKFVSNTFTGVTLDCTSATVHSGTTATDTVVDGFGSLVVLGGRAIDTDVREYGSLSIDYGGTANGITTQNDAYIEVKNGGKLTGAMTIGTGAYITAEAGATFDFDISPYSPGNAAVVDDLSVVMSQPFDFTITVDGMQEKGSYTLAENATGFGEQLDVYNTTGIYLGYLGVTGSAKTLMDGRDYTLTLSGSDLCLTIGKLPDEDTDDPTVENIQADITTPTNKDVTVTADFLDYSGIAERRYKLAGDTDWSIYPDYGVTVTENTTVYFMAVDVTGRESSEETITIDYIDKEAPTIVVTPSTTGLTESLTLKAEFDDNDYVVGAYYKIADDVWNPYSDEGVTVTENTTVAFQAYDEAGNETTVVYEVKNIGKADITGDLNTTFNLTDGMIGSDVNILDGGELNVSSGGVALDTTVNSGGELSIDSGGKADIVTVNPGGTFYVNSGGAAYQVRENGGEVWGYLGMVVEIVPNEFTGVTIGKGDDATVHSGTTATDTTVQSGGFLEVYSGGTATGIIAEQGASLDLTVAPGTYEQGTYAGTGFEIGDTANGFRVHSRCRVFVSKGGIVRETAVSSDGWLYVSSGGVASDTTIEEKGDLAIREGGSASGITVRSGGYIFNNAGGSATGIVAADGAILFLDIAPDTYAQGTYNGSAFAFDSAVAGITVDSHCYIIPTIQDGGTADDITIGSGGYLYVSNGGSADDITVEKGGTLFMYGGKATQVRENGGCVMDYYDAVTYVSNTFTGLTITDSATVHSGTTAANTTVGKGGNLQISGGAATGTTVNDGAAVTIYYSGTADGTTVNSGGSFNMAGYNGIANNTTVNDGGKFYAPGGTVNGLVVGSGGSFEFHGKLTGKAVFDENAVVNVDGAKVDFDLTQTAPGEDALFNDLSFVMHPSTSYTLTVDASAEAGAYKLAEGAAGFTTETITVKNTVGDTLGTLTADGSTKTFNGRDYTLTLTTEGLLGLTLGEMPADLSGNLNTTYDLTKGKYGSGVIVNSDGHLNIEEGAVAKEITVNSGGCVDVSAGGKADIIDVNPGAYFYVYEGATALNIRENGGYAGIDGTAIVTIVPNTFFDLVLENGGDATAHAGTTARNITLNEGGMLLLEGGTAEQPTVNSGGELILTYGTVKGGEINNGGLLDVLLDGTIDGVTVNQGGRLIASGGSALNIVENGGYVDVYEAAAASFEANAFDAGKIENAMVTVHSGTTATNAEVGGGGYLLLFSGGSATDVKETGGCVSTEEDSFVTFLPSDLTGLKLDKTARPYATVHSGTTATNATITDATVLAVYEGGIADDVALDGEGIFYVREGAVVSGAAINNGYFYVSGSAVDATVQGVGYARIEDGGVMNGVKVAAGAELCAYAGGKLTGWMQFETGAIVSAYGGSVVDFDLTQTVAGVESLISNYSLIKGGAAYTLTVDGTQETGTYYLAASASAFNKTITVRNVSGTEYGTISVGGDPLSTTFADFTLKMTGDTLAVGVTKKEVLDELNPMIEVSANTEAPTNGNVTLTAVFDDDVAVAQSLYSIDGGESWLDYTAPVVVTENTSVSFMAVDTSGKETFYYYHVTNIDKEDPTIDVSPDTTAPAASVTVTAVFDDNVALASRQYRIGSGAWTVYTDSGVTVTDNVTVYFKAVDTAGNVKETSITINNIEKDTTCPTITDVKADITGLTNQNVTVTAVFDDDVALASKLYKLQGDTDWTSYPDGGVVVDKNTTVYFKAVDTSGNEANNSITISNIDKVAPTITGITPSTTAPAASVTVTATFSDNVSLASRQYRIGSGAWTVYTDSGVLVTENVTVTFKAVDTAGNDKEASYNVTNIEEAITSNEPANNWLYKKPNWNSDASIALFYVNNVVALAANETQLIYLDTKGTVDSGDGKYNSISRTKVGEETVKDASDYAKIELAYGAALRFSVDSEVAGTFYVYEKTKDKKGNDIAKQCQKITVKADKTSPAKLTTIYLNAGEYYVGMEAKLPSARKYPEYNAYYNVQLTGTKYFEKADGGWNDSVYALDVNKKEIKTELDPTLESKALALGRSVMAGSNPGAIKLDDGAAGTDDWVGFTDATDYRMFTLDKAVNLTLSLSVSATETGYGRAKLTLWKVTRNARTGKITLASKGAVVVKQDATGLIKSKFLAAGEYFVSVTSADAKKGGDVSYSVKVDEKTLFFDSADNSFNNVLYNKKGKAFYGEDATHHFETTVINGAGIDVKLDSEAVGDAGYENFVGYGDAADYAKIELATGGNLSFDLKATGNATFVVYKKGKDSKGNDTLEAIQTTKLTVAKDKDVVETMTDTLTGLDAGEYYVSMTAKSTKANASGSVFYNVMATLEPSGSSALSMPETSDSLAMTDSLSFGGYDVDVLADASTSALAELDDKAGWLNIASLA